MFIKQDTVCMLKFLRFCRQSKFGGVFLMILYCRQEYIIFQQGTGLIIYNTKKNFKNGHTHINSYNVAKTVINNVIKKKIPKTRSKYLLESHIRVSDDECYCKKIQNLINVRQQKGKKLSYRNRSV